MTRPLGERIQPQEAVSGKQFLMGRRSVHVKLLLAKLTGPRLFIAIALLLAAVSCESRLPLEEPAESYDIFNGRDLTGWIGNNDYWSVEDGQIVGRSEEPIPRNEFLFTEGEFGDFYFAVSVQLLPDEA